ncbi:MAG TPA: HAD-IIA family hydrolase [Calditrichia bacterium]|nr:HAD-IIA family hydrolase [Calditrichota bacterium]HQU70675.1 HAD-IIA family hydrolase [Calditrichia bacterium]HQV32359.1 HAD-IIA family hydrolase [Calditrichia bacterium]
MSKKLKNIICDIDGVLLHQNSLIEGSDRFIARVLKQGNPLIILTNYPSQTQADLQNRLREAGIEVPESVLYTSAMATAAFLSRQEGRKAFVVGEGGLTHELYKSGFTITDINPDVVVVGETKSYNVDMIQKAAYFIMKGARFIATNPDVAGPKGEPACGALCAPIERITGKKPFYVGKPSAWMMRAALNNINAHSENTVIIGDNLNTDILAGIQAGLETILVLTGYSQMDDIQNVPFRPNHIFARAADIDVV